MVSLSFSQGLILFIILQVLVYITILFLVPSPLNKDKRNTKGSLAFGKSIDTIAKQLTILLLPLTITLIWTSQYKDTFLYQSLYATTFTLFAISIILNSNSFIPTKVSRFHIYLLASIVLFHVVTLLNSWGVYTFPFPQVTIEERTPAIAKLIIDGSWDPNLKLLNPTYNPLPADVVGIAFLLMVQGSSPTSPSNTFIWCTMLIAIFDISLFLFVKLFTKNSSIAFLSVLLFILTPPLNIVAHIPRNTAILLILLLLLLLIQMLNDRSRRNILTILLLYNGAIFYHLMAVQVSILLEFLVVTLWLFASKALGVAWKQNRNEINLSSLLHLLSALFLMIALIKLLWTQGAFSQVINPLITLINNLFNIRHVPEEITPNYERNVTFINAYSWTTMPALATAFTIYSLSKLRSNNTKIEIEHIASLALYGASAFLLLIGFISALTGAGFHPDIYPSATFMLPAASLALLEISRRSQFTFPLLLSLLAISSLISIGDPMLNIYSYNRMRTAADVPPGISTWYVEAGVLSHVLNPGTQIFAPYEMAAYLLYKSVVNGTNYMLFSGSVDVRRAELLKIEKDGMIREDVLYIWPEWWPLGIGIIKRIGCLGECPNVFYNSGRYLVFIESS
jgi:hypothetical protein